MRRTASVLLIMVILFSFAGYGISANEEDIEIKFKVGDSVIQINGQAVEVEKPFVENGVTLVPLRVITEAFGAQVLWEEATQKITLIYNVVTIVLQIDNKFAAVNQEEQELLAAPKIVNEKTMVPLRFITETFGAKVTYDEKTQGISVVKEKPKAESDNNDAKQEDTKAEQETAGENTQSITVSEADESGYKTYTNQVLNLSFKFPQAYQVLSDTGINEIGLYKEDKYGIVTSVIYLSVFYCGEDATAAEMATEERNYLSTYQEEAKDRYNQTISINSYICSNLQADQTLSGFDTRYFIYSTKTKKMKTMYAVNNGYSYNLRFFDRDINWLSPNSNSITILKDIQIQDTKNTQDSIIEEWTPKNTKENPNITQTIKPTYFSSDYRLALAPTWKNTGDAEAYFGNYGAVYGKPQNAKEIGDGYVKYPSPQTPKFHNAVWKETNQNIAVIHESGIVFHIAQMKITDNTYPLMYAFYHTVKNDPRVTSISLDISNNSLLNHYSQLQPYQITNRPNFYATYLFRYTYQSDEQVYYNTLYQFNTDSVISYFVNISIPEKLYTPSTHKIIENIIGSISLRY